MNLLPVSWRNRLEDLRDQVQSVVTRWVPRMRRGGRRSSETWMPTRVFAAGPNIDVEESPDEIIVRAELPGLNRDEFTVDASPDALFIRGEKKYQRESRSFGFHRFECAQGRFIRAVPLP
ncbi:MAG TPA: Hsp20/alpha crystallin family protein, partial [bacterium]|nr:Hsp20/alpha crystallin family protein [bacterium]